MLIIDALSKKLDRKPVLRGASMRHEGAQILWVRGPNGTGKSTLLKCVAGVWRPDGGDVSVHGRSVVNDARARVQVGYVPDTFAPFPNLTVTETLSLIAALKRSPLPDPAQLERFGIMSFAHQSVTLLSAGQTRRAALVAGLIGDPWLLVLDEPTTGLDIDGVALLRETLVERRDRGKAALLVTHDPSFAQSLGVVAYDIVDGALRAAP